MLALTLSYPTLTAESTIVPTPEELRQLYEDTKAFQIQAKINALFNTPQVLTLSDAPHWLAEAEPLPSAPLPSAPLLSALVSALLKQLETLTAPARSVARYVQEIPAPNVAYTALSLSVVMLVIGCGSMGLKLLRKRPMRARKRSKKARTRSAHAASRKARQRRQMKRLILTRGGVLLPNPTGLPNQARRPRRLAKVLALTEAIKSFIKDTAQSAFSKVFNNNNRGT